MKRLRENTSTGSHEGHEIFGGDGDAHLGEDVDAGLPRQILTVAKDSVHVEQNGRNLSPFAPCIGNLPRLLLLLLLFQGRYRYISVTAEKTDPSRSEGGDGRGRSGERRVEWDEIQRSGSRDERGKWKSKRHYAKFLEQ